MMIAVAVAIYYSSDNDVAIENRHDASASRIAKHRLLANGKDEVDHEVAVVLYERLLLREPRLEPL
jgi:hypothetical protein